MADSRRPRDAAAVGRCRNHPWHRQSPGVCSLCLTDRLSSSSASRKASYLWTARSASSSSPSSVSTYYSSSSSSSDEDEEHSYRPSPSRRPRRGVRLPDDTRSGPLTLSALFFGGGLRKSRSMAAEVEARDGDAEAQKKKKKKKKEEEEEKGKGSRGFWSKILASRKKRSGSSVGQKAIT